MPRRPLPEAIRDPGFTPRAHDLDALVDLLVVDEAEKHAERAIVRLGVAAVDGLRARFDLAKPPLRSRLVRAVGHLASEGARVMLLAALGDTDPKTRRNAAIALGHAHGEGVEDALLEAWEADPRPEMRRSIAASLGKVGSARALPLLRGAASAKDAELARIGQRSVMMVERTGSRSERGVIDATHAPPAPMDVVVLTRHGLEDLAAAELSVLVGAVSDVREDRPGQVRARLMGPMGALFAVRTMLGFRFPLASVTLRAGESEEDAITRAVTSDQALVVFSTWTIGAVRYRLAWSDGRHRRAATWATARAIARHRPQLVNDPTASLWEVLVERRGDAVEISLSPRALKDPRFAWRRHDVPAASHPTMAAALARVAGAREDDVVWDPFVGSGAELVERALLGKYRALHGSDVDPRALLAARANLTAAGQEATLQEADALTVAPSGVTLIITNPPMGRRASRTSGLAHMLDRFVAHAAAVLVRGGRLVWIAPWPELSRSVGLAAGLKLERARVVDMGGFDAEMQRWMKS